MLKRICAGDKGSKMATKGEEWASVVKGSKALSGPLGQGIRK
jgi:hypothetical protein